MDGPDASLTRAEDIEKTLELAWEHLRLAAISLRHAQNVAEADYDHNASRLHQINGAFDLVQGAVSQEMFTWAGYARARRQR